ncbi:DUF5677 domain-containing protein [Kordiimonas laminariae]|uniref:DUF5677 domain-containing protein n=1 Tax=Kordiimonas laminariae TaxID=2917717 RepID=UPI001FF56326|nr:DUF5677 domain-containing protein [Kordiimonas laminariae]MCK0070857.1 DUF5677 domain-containing protein [Kordiimonas laminariae]
MTDLTEAIEDMIQTNVPKLVLRSLLEKKLGAHGVKDKTHLDALADHILSGKEERFSWDDGEEGTTKNINLNFTEEEVSAFHRDVEAFYNESIPKVLLRTVKDSAQNMVANLEESWPEHKAYENDSMNGFRSRLDARWSVGLDPLRMMLAAAKEIGEEFVGKISSLNREEGSAKDEVITVLHIRACRTVMEILTLLENGLPDGAFARWRTLYEISIVAFVIDRFGNEVAERYMAHEVVSLREEVKNEYRYNGQEYELESLPEDLKEIEEDFQAAITLYGSSFSGPYGWAAKSLNEKQPRFKHLEEAVDWPALPPDYKLSSYRIHAGIAGAYTSLDLIDGTPRFHAGAINSGLDGPAILTAFSLLHVTSLVYGNEAEVETQIQMQTMLFLRDKVVDGCRQAAEALVEDEASLREHNKP